MNPSINNLITALNSLSERFCDYAGSMFVQSGVLIVLLLFVELLIRKRVRATLRYWIWMLVFIKLILPPSFSLPTGIGYWRGDILSAALPAMEEKSIHTYHEFAEPPLLIDETPLLFEIPQNQLPQTNVKLPSPVTPVVSHLNALTWQAIAFVLWLVGVLIFSVLLIQRIFFVRRLIAESKPSEKRFIEILNQCYEEIGIRHPIKLRLSNNVSSPAVCGFLKPVILMPTELIDKLSPDRLRAVLIHELCHIKKGDLWINSVQTILQIIYFYNPLVWLANLIVRRIREQAVDEMVLVTLGSGAKDYSNTLIDIAEMAFFKTSLSLRLIGVVKSKKALHRRIRHMLNRPIPKNVKLGILGLMTVVILGVVLLPMAKAQKQFLDSTAVASDSEKNSSVVLSAATIKTGLDVVDSDGDGLSDFQEVHKYLTNPAKRDTDGDSLSDGDWNERREYTYSVRTILKFMPPFDKAVLNDNYQDARILEKTDDYIEIEVIHYPLATTHESIEENPNWQRDYAGMTDYLKAGITTNWDAKMKHDLLTELRADGILIDKLTDKQAVTRISSWLMKRSRSLDKVFTTYYAHFPNGQPSVYPGLEGAFEHEFNRDKENYDWTMNQHFNHELLGKGMFYNKTHGSCTSFAIFLTTVLRALGIPTRIIIVVPVVDPSDREQLMLANQHITNNKVRETMLAGLRRVSKGFTNHTFNEVYVGNRWRRLNYNKLGQPILDQHLFGLQTHLYTFNDLSDVELARTWGWRYAKGEKNSTFTHSNPYSAIALSDHFGCHSNLANPPFVAEDLSTSPLPNIFILEPARRESSDFSIWDEVTARVEQTTYNKTGRVHQKEYYDNIFNGVFTKKPGDVIVLFFSLDTKERIPEDYQDLLPEPWPEIEANLQEGNIVELKGKARDSNIILLAAPRREQLRQLIRKSELLRRSQTEQAEGRKPLASKTRPSSGLPNIFIMSPSNFGMFREIVKMVEDITWNKTGRYHNKKSYDKIFVDEIHNKKTGDIIVLLFSLDSPDRIPSEYEDLLPKPWSEIESALKQGKTVELKGKARELNVILLAAPTSEKLRSLVQESNQLNPSAKPSQSRVQTSGSSATLPDGVMVELVGVCEHPSEGKQWWRPDGTLTENAPYKSTGSRLKHHEGYNDYEFVLRLTGLSDTSYKWEVSGSRQGSSTGAPIGKDGSRVYDLRVYTANQNRNKKTASVRIGLTAAKWDTSATYIPKDREETYSLTEGAIAFGVPYEKEGDTLLPVVHNFNQGHHTVAIRVIAITDSGVEFASSTRGSSGNVLSSLTYGFEVPLNNIREFRFQTRPYIWIEFKNVSLQPGMKTNVQGMVLEGNINFDEAPSS